MHTARMIDSRPSLQNVSPSRPCKGWTFSQLTTLDTEVRLVHLGCLDSVVTFFLDLHSGNIALEVPGLKFLRESDLLDELGEPEMGLVTRSDGKPLEANVPTHIVRPARFRTSTVLSSPSIKIIDFGEAFLNSNVPSTLHTPLSVRAPEVVFGDRLDLRVDLWSAGCLVRTPMHLQNRESDR